MTLNQIKQWAAEAKIDLQHQVSLRREPVWIATDEELAQFAALVAQHEREQCAPAPAAAISDKYAFGFLNNEVTPLTKLQPEQCKVKAQG